MTGPFNTIGHETEQISRDASAELMTAMSALYTMLEALERSDVVAAEQRRIEVIDRLQNSAKNFDHATEVAGDYLLSTSGDHAHAIELASLYAQLSELNYKLPFNNPQLSAIAAIETRLFSNIVETVPFYGSPSDWMSFRTIIETASRLLSIGLILARISALHGH